MKKALIKDTFREIKKSFGRFISIFGIVLVGVAFFTGVKSSATHMRNAADNYFDNTNFLDLKIYSSIGFDKDDVETITSVDGIEYAAGINSVEDVTIIDDIEKTIQIFSSDFDDKINELRLTEGRFPEKEGECVVRDYSISGKPAEIGDEITITTEALKNKKYTIVGKVDTPYYLSYQYDSTTVGSGKISDVFYVKADEFVSDRYSAVFATVAGAKEQFCYDDEYFDVVSPVKERIEALETVFKEKYSIIPDVSLFVLDRNSHFSYVDYGNCADRMDAIAKVFPVFFYLVAALVCLTTMTRMVDEQRGNIGTLKALGYSKTSIAMKYVIYALMASLSGGLIGCVVGLNTFPKIIYSSWNIVYTVRDFTRVPELTLCIAAVAIAVGVNVFATMSACMSELIETPALLLRPKSPKNGKKVFLEHIPFIWKRLNFSKKVTARNILRYKKRFFMTVIGIAGCTTLILAGFGIKNSVSLVADEQYGDIFKYDMSGKLGDSVDREEFYDKYINDEGVSDLFLLATHSSIAKKTDEPGAKEKKVSFVIVPDGKRYNEFTELTDNKSGENVVINDEGAVITYKLAKDFNVGIGDSIFVGYEDEQYYEVKVSNIVKMYVGQYVFVSDKYFEEITGNEYESNFFISTLNIKDEEEQQKFGSAMMDEYDISNVSYYDGIAANFNKTISSLSIITVVLIVSAGMLAFIVLYNLINVNISERIREIATIKVLGFYDREVASYVYRENNILCVIGALVGLGLGKLLHSYIMIVIEMDDVIFPKTIFWQSYIFAFVITIVFGILVNYSMYKRLKNIPMVESLKSVE